MNDLRKSVLNKNPRGFGPIRMPQDFSPLKPTDYFDSEERIITSNGTFHVYKKGSTGPILCCLHGGGYSGLTWALFAAEICNNIDCQVVAIDLRGHGSTTTQDDGNLALSSMSKDVVEVIEKLSENQDTAVVLIGHSMGGAVAVDAAHLLPSIAGLCVIDVVEGTALEALSSMQNILRGRPSSFKSLENAIQWCFRSGQTRNIEAARISMPGQLIQAETKTIDPPNDLSLREVDEESEDATDFAKPPLPKKLTPSISTSPNSSTSSASTSYVWRIDLKKTEPYWTGWFEGLSQKFLDLHIPKILLLANIHGLDTALTVGQMQGKFRMQILAKSGHAIHEDQPHQVAEIISVYLVKHKLATVKEGFEVPISKMFM